MALLLVAVPVSALAASAADGAGRSGQPGRPLRLVAFGDSLTAGYGLRPEQSFPACLERLLRAEGIEATVANAGVSGDTTAMGLERLDWSIPDTPDGVIVELGANDGLRGLPLAQIEANLEAIVTRLQARGIPVMLAGMKAILNMGEEYGRGYAAVFARLAERHRLVFYPFFLEGVAGRDGLNLADGVHPNAAGVEEIARRILPSVETFIKRITGKQSS